MKILEEEPPLASEFKLPWLVNAFLYPISTSGLIYLAVFVLLPLLFSLFIRLLTLLLQPYLGQGTFLLFKPLTIIFYIVFYSYMCYYIADCVINSAKGHQRALCITITNTFSIGDLVTQAAILLGCVAICMWPAGLYYGLIRWDLTQRDDRLLWLLIVTGVFFLPMSLLRGIMFDAFDALNPILIIWSILKTFLPYCGLVLFFLAVGGFITAVLPRLPLWTFLIQGVKIYLVFVLAHRLGWFYWWHKDKLAWGI